MQSYRRPRSPVNCAPAGGGWEFENEHYRLRLGRSGTITGLWTKGLKHAPLSSRANCTRITATAKPRMRHAASNDVESRLADLGSARTASACVSKDGCAASGVLNDSDRRSTTFSITRGAGPSLRVLVG